MTSTASTLCILPRAKAAAAENMAIDWLMLEDFPETESPRLRFYGWSQPAFTFGYGQRWETAHALCRSNIELVRRPTGGGLVDHRDDWTYSLALPASHPLAKERACESYREVHDALAQALEDSGVGCLLQGADCKTGNAAAAVCFQKAETFDVIRKDNGRKIAGAGQKRTRRGVLMQGSIARAGAWEIKDWNALDSGFMRYLAALLECDIALQPTRHWTSETLARCAKEFASTSWNKKR